MSKIIQLNAENVKVLKAIEIKPEGNIIELSGKNGQGKSSVLDSIIMAIAGKKYQPEKPVREGEEEANISIDIGNLLIKRKIKKDGSSTVKITTKEGATFSSPQAILDELFSNISFDPLQFSNMKPKDQFEQLKSILKIDFNFEKNEAERKVVYEDRTIVNRKIKESESLIKDINYPNDTPDNLIVMADILKQIEEVEVFNKEVREKELCIEGNEILIERAEEEIKKREMEIESLKKQQEEIQKDTLLKKEELKETGGLKETIHLKETLKNAEVTNDNIRLKLKKKELSDNLDQQEKQAQILTNKITELDKEKQDAISSCKMPVEGLSFGDNSILYNGIPFEQCSQAEKIKISSSIAMAAENEKHLKVVLIKDGSLLDEDNMKIITDMAIEKDYQVWIEKVDSTGQIGIVIEEGEIKNVK